MRQIHILHDQLDYVGLLTAPAFHLFASPTSIASGLYYAFNGLHGGTGDITFERDSQPLEQVCVVELGEQGTYRFSLERVEWTRPDAWSWELNASVLARGDVWLRGLRRGGPLMHSHYLTYSAHAFIEGGTSVDVLWEIGGPTLQGFGESQGTGVIFHALVAPEQRTAQLTVDHSHVVPQGLFLQMVMVIEEDQIDYAQIGGTLLELFHRALTGLGLVSVTGVG